MWYGSAYPTNLQLREQNNRHRLNLRDRKLGKINLRRNSYPAQTTILKVPLEWDFILLSPKLTTKTIYSIYLYNQTYFLNCVTTSPSQITKIDPQVRAFKFYHYTSSYCHLAYFRSLELLFNLFNRPFFLKIRFKGKGYYVYKNKRNTIAPQFGYAHRVYVYAHAHSVKFLSKTKILLFGLSKTDLFSTGYSLKAVKPINIFTGRGVRFARQVIYKKTGKVSSYR